MQSHYVQPNYSVVVVLLVVLCCRWGCDNKKDSNRRLKKQKKCHRKPKKMLPHVLPLPPVLSGLPTLITLITLPYWTIPPRIIIIPMITPDSTITRWSRFSAIVVGPHIIITRIAFLSIPRKTVFATHHLAHLAIIVLSLSCLAVNVYNSTT